MAATTLALCEQDERLPGFFAIRALIKRVVAEWQRGMWEEWRWPESTLLPSLMQHTFRADLEVERERVQWRRAAGLPETKGRFVRGEWRDRIANLTSLDDAQKQQLAAKLRGGAIMEAAAETTRSLEVLIKTIEMPEGLNGQFREGFRDAFLKGMKNGSGKAAKQLGFGQDWLLKDPKAMASLTDYAGYYGDHLTKLVGQEWQVAVKKAVLRGIDQGMSAAEMSREITGVVDGLTGYEAERIARTEAARARVNGRLGTYLGAGVQMLEYIVGPNPCTEICLPRAGQLYTVSTIRAILPGHPNCFPGDVKVLTRTGYKAISEVVIGEQVFTHERRWRKVTQVMQQPYSGQMVEISAGERALRGTPEHPILTRRGWVGLALIDEADEVVCEQFADATRIYSNNLPALFGKVLRLPGILSAFARRVMPSAAVNLNAEKEIGESNINVVCPGGEEGNGGKAAGANHIDSSGLIMRKSSASGPLYSLCSFAKRFPRSLAAARCNIGIMCLHFSLLVRSHPVTEQLCFAIGSPLNPITLHGFHNAVSVTPNMGSYSLYSHALDEVHSPEHLSSVGRMKTRDRLIATIHWLLSPQRKLYQRVHHIASAMSEGNVYNLSVEEDHSYIANGIVVHNCECDAVASDDDLNRMHALAGEGIEGWEPLPQAPAPRYRQG